MGWVSYAMLHHCTSLVDITQCKHSFNFNGQVWYDTHIAYTDAQTFVWEQVEDIQSFLEDHWLEDLEGTTT